MPGRGDRSYKKSRRGAELHGGRQTAAEEEEGDAGADAAAEDEDAAPDDGPTETAAEGEVQVQAVEDGDEEEPGEAPATFSFRNTNRLTRFYSTTAFSSLLRSLNRDIIFVVPHVNGNTGAISLNVRWRASMEQTVQKGRT